MQRRARRSKPSWIAWLFSLLALVLILGAWLALLHFTVGSEIPSTDDERSELDTLYFAVHAGIFLLALAAGFAIGKWLNGLGVAFALLFGVVITSAFGVGQVAAYEAACHGQNDIIRHWTC